MKKAMSIIYDKILNTAVKLIGGAMLLAILLQILSRTFLKLPFPWTDELARMAFLWYCFLGTVLTTRQKLHLGIDYFRSKLNAKGQFINDAFVFCCIILFGAVIMIFGMQLLNIVKIQKSPVMRLQMTYFYMVLPLSGGLISLQGLEFLLDHIKSPRKAVER